jgi:hypothetical protein
MYSLDIDLRPTFPYAVSLLAAGVLLVLGWWLYRGASVPRGRQRMLLLLRLLAVTLVLFLLFRPVVILTETRQHSATLVLLVDRSRSMSVRDAVGGASRWEALQQMFEQCRPALEKISKFLRVESYYFDQKLYTGEEAPEVAPTGPATALGDALRQSLERVGGRVAAMVLLTDGASNAGQIPPLQAAELLRDLRVPIHTVGFGQATAATTGRDLAFRSISAGPEVFAKTKLQVAGELIAVGYPGAQAKVTLSFNESPVQDRVIRFENSPVQLRVEQEAVAEQPGELKVTLEATALGPGESEAVTSNNRISTWVTVLGGGLKVLVIEGSAQSWEGTFLRRSLDRAREIQAVLLRASDPGTLQKRLEQIKDEPFDVIILRDVPATWLPEHVLQQWQVAVSKGLGLAMLGGERSFGPGGYAKSPLATVLPVRLRPDDRVTPQPTRVIPTEEGLVHYVMRLAPAEAETRRLWESLAPLRGANILGEPKAAARVLARSEQNLPLLVAQDYGAGRTLVFAGDTTWQWHLQSEEGLQAHRRFWRQVALWLARREEKPGVNVWLQLPQRRVRAGASLEAVAGAEDEQGRPLEGARFQLEVVAPDGSVHPVRLYPQGEWLRAVFWETKEAGDYTVRLSVYQGDELTGGPVERKFLVYDEDREMSSPGADLELLQKIASLTGGRYLLPEELPDFLASLKPEDFRLQVERRTHIRLWDRWLLLLALVAFLTVEWVIRKCSGLP